MTAARRRSVLTYCPGPMRCPACGGAAPTVTSRAPSEGFPYRTRYHTCGNCGRHYKTTQASGDSRTARGAPSPTD